MSEPSEHDPAREPAGDLAPQPHTDPPPEIGASEVPAPTSPDPSADPAPWGLKGAILLPLLSFGGQLVLGLLVGGMAAAALMLLDPNITSNPEDFQEAILLVSLGPVALASSILTLGLIYVSVTVVARRPFLASLGLTRPSAPGLARSGGLGAAMALLYVGIAGVFPPDPEVELGGPLTRLAESGPFGHALWLGLAVLVAPVIEELLFRGYMFLGARRRLGPVGAGVAVTITFVALHLPETGTYWPAVAGIASMATALIMVMHRTGKLTYCIAGHLGYNAALAGLSILPA